MTATDNGLEAPPTAPSDGISCMTDRAASSNAHPFVPRGLMALAMIRDLPGAFPTGGGRNLSTYGRFKNSALGSSRSIGGRHSPSRYCGSTRQPTRTRWTQGVRRDSHQLTKRIPANNLAGRSIYWPAGSTSQLRSTFASRVIC